MRTRQRRQMHRSTSIDASLLLALIAVTCTIVLASDPIQVGCNVSDLVLRDVVAAVKFDAESCTALVPSASAPSGSVNLTFIEFRNVTLTGDSRLKIDIASFVNSSLVYFEQLESPPIRLSVSFTNCTVSNQSILWLGGYSYWRDVPSSRQLEGSTIAVGNSTFMNSTLLIGGIMPQRSNITLRYLSFLQQGTSSAPVLDIFGGAVISLLAFAAFHLHTWSSLVIGQSTLVGEYSADDDFTDATYSILTMTHGEFSVRDSSSFVLTGVTATSTWRIPRPTIPLSRPQVVVVRIGPPSLMFSFGIANASLFRIEHTNLTSDLSGSCFSYALESSLLTGDPFVSNGSAFEIRNAVISAANATALVFASSILAVEASTIAMYNSTVTSMVLSELPTIRFTGDVTVLHASSMEFVSLRISNQGMLKDSHYVVGWKIEGAVDVSNSSELVLSSIGFSFSNAAVFSSTLKYPSLAMSCSGLLRIIDSSRFVVENVKVDGGAVMLNFATTVSGYSTWKWKNVSIVCTVCDSYPTSALTILSLIVVNHSSVAFLGVLFSTVAASPLATSRNPAAINISSTDGVVVEYESSFILSNSTLTGGSGMELMGGLLVRSGSHLQVNSSTVRIFDLSSVGSTLSASCLMLFAVEVRDSSEVLFSEINIETQPIGSQFHVLLVRHDAIASTKSSLQISSFAARLGSVFFSGSIDIESQSLLRLEALEILQYRVGGAVMVTGESVLVLQTTRFDQSAAVPTRGSVVFEGIITIDLMGEVRVDNCTIAPTSNLSALPGSPGFVMYGALLLATNGVLNMSYTAVHSLRFAAVIMTGNSGLVLRSLTPLLPFLNDTWLDWSQQLTLSNASVLWLDAITFIFRSNSTPEFQLMTLRSKVVMESESETRLTNWNVTVMVGGWRRSSTSFLEMTTTVQSSLFTLSDSYFEFAGSALGDCSYNGNLLSLHGTSVTQSGTFLVRNATLIACGGTALNFDSVVMETGGILAVELVQFQGAAAMLSLASIAVHSAATVSVSRCVFAVASATVPSGGPSVAAFSVTSMMIDSSTFIFQDNVVGANRTMAPQLAISLAYIWSTNAAQLLIERSVLNAQREALSLPNCYLSSFVNFTVSNVSLFSHSDTVMLLGLSLTSNDIFFIQNNTLSSSYRSLGYNSNGILNLSNGVFSGRSTMRIEDVVFLGEQAITIGCFSVDGSDWTLRNIAMTQFNEFATPIAFMRFPSCRTKTVHLTGSSVVTLTNIYILPQQHQEVVSVIAFGGARSLTIALGTTMTLSLIRANGTVIFPPLTVTNASTLKIQNCTLEVARLTVFGCCMATPLQFAGTLDVKYGSTLTLEWLELFAGFDLESPKAIRTLLFQQNVTVSENSSAILQKLTLAGQRAALGNSGPPTSSLIWFNSTVVVSDKSRLILRSSLLAGVAQLPGGYPEGYQSVANGRTPYAINVMASTRFGIPTGITFASAVRIMMSSVLMVRETDLITSRSSFNRSEESACILLLADVYVTLHSAFVIDSGASSSLVQMIGSSIIEFGPKCQSCSVIVSADSSLMFDLNARLYQGEERLLGQGVAGVRFTSPTMSLIDGSTCRVSGLIVFVNGTTAVDGIVATLASVVFADASVVKIDTTSGLEFRDLKTGCTLRCALDFAVVLPAVDSVVSSFFPSANVPVSFSNVEANSSRGLLRRGVNLTVLLYTFEVIERRSSLGVPFFCAGCNRWNNVTYSVEGLPKANLVIANQTVCPVVFSHTGSRRLTSGSGTVARSSTSLSDDNSHTLSRPLANPLPSGTVDPSRRLSSVATTLSSMPLILVSSPGAGLAMQRAVMQLQLQECEYSLGDSLDLATSPTTLRFGAANGQYIRGAVVGNVLLMVGVSILAALVSRVRCYTAERRGHAMTLWRASASLALPGWLVAPLGFLLQPSTTVGVATAVHFTEGGGWPDVVLGTFGLAVCVGLCLYVTWVVTCGFAARPEPIPGRSEVAFVQILLPRFRWRDLKRGSFFVRRFDSLFAEFRPGRVWFVAVELWMAFATGVIGGVMPPDEATCRGLLIAMCVLQVGFLVLAVVAHPSNAALDPILLLNAAAGVMWNVVVLIPSLNAVASVVAATQVWVGVLALVFHLARMIASGRLRALAARALRLLGLVALPNGRNSNAGSTAPNKSDFASCFMSSSDSDAFTGRDEVASHCLCSAVDNCRSPSVIEAAVSPDRRPSMPQKKSSVVVAARSKSRVAECNGARPWTDDKRCFHQNLKVLIELICQRASRQTGREIPQ